MERPCRKAGSFFNEAQLRSSFHVYLFPAQYRFTRNFPECQEPAAAQAAQVFPGRMATRHA
jgi:hypothetical protein